MQHEKGDVWKYLSFAEAFLKFILVIMLWQHICQASAVLHTKFGVSFLWNNSQAQEVMQYSSPVCLTY